MRLIKRLLTFIFHPITLFKYSNFKGTIIYPSVKLKNGKLMCILNSQIVRGGVIKAFDIEKDSKIKIFIKDSYVGDNCYISSAGNLHIFKCNIAPKVFIGTYNHALNSLQKDSAYTIKITKSFIGQGAMISGNITIDNNSVIGFGSIVKHNVETNTMVAGNPAHPIKKNNTEKHVWERIK